MRHWLLKSEPGTYSWNDLARDKKTSWDGVRNYQARNFLNDIQKGDRAYLYHSGDDKCIVGLMEITKSAYPDTTAEKGESWVTVDLKPLKKAGKTLDLKSMKANPVLKGTFLVRNSRLSVSPLTEEEVNEIEILISK